MKNLINNLYVMLNKIGEGSFGQIYNGENYETGEKVAIKLEEASKAVRRLKNEAVVYRSLAGTPGIPRYYWYGQYGEHNCLVMELCGTCLSDYVAGMPDGHFSLKTVLLLADQLFPLIRAVHARDFLHRDIKPSNLLMGTGHLSGQAYLLDFGLAKRFRDREKQVHVPYADGKRITGTSRYVSINTHLGIEQSRRDDMESIGYTLVFLAKGSLPWQRVAFPDNGSQSAHEAILQKKLATSYEALCDGLPREFVEYFRIVRALGFEEEPPYQRLRDMFSACFNKLGYVFDGRFDWTDSREVVPRASHKLAVAVHGPSFGDEEVLGKPGEVPIREEPGPLLWNLRRRGDLVASFPKSVARKRVKSAKR